MIEKDFIVDDFVFVGNKRFKLNLNDYRNAHFYILNDAKKNFKKNLFLSYPELQNIKAKHLKLNYTILPCRVSLFDTGNIIAIVDKFFLDALVDCGCIPDDNYKIVSYDKPPAVFPGISRENKNKKILISCKFFD